MTDCYRCGQDDHHRSQCPRDEQPSRRRLWPKGQPPEPKPSEQDKLPAYVRLDLTRHPEEIADYEAWGAVARELLAAVTGQPQPDGPYVITPFRTKLGLPPRTDGELRAIAREQVAAIRGQSPDQTRSISASSALPVLHAPA